MTRLARACLAGMFAGLLAIGGASAASNGPAPGIAGISSHLVSAYQDLTVSGSSFSSDLAPSDCGFAGPPTVHFKPLNGAATIDVRPAGTDPAHCTDSSVHVAIPAALTGAARVSLTDPQGQASNDNQVVTVVPQAGLSPAAGPTGATTTIRGSGLRPPSLAVVNGTPQGVSLTIGGGGRGFDAGAWTDSALPFDPRNTGGTVVFSFNVVNDLSRPASDRANLTRVDVNAGNYNFQPPAPEQGTLARQVVGSRFHVAGRYLGGGGSAIFPGGASTRGQNWSSDGFDLTVPAGAQPGRLTISVDGFGSVPGPVVPIDPRLSALTPTSTSAGQPVRVTGFNFGGTTGRVSVGGNNQSVISWGDQAVSFNLAQDSDGGAVALVRSDGAAVAAGVLTVVPRLDRLESNSVVPGAQVVVDGVSLGSNNGTATIGPLDAVPLLWSRTSVLLQLPTSLVPGTYPVTVATAGGAHSNSLNLVVVAAPTAAPGTTVKPGSTPAATAAPAPGGILAPSFDNNHDFVKPIKPPSPVYFNITTDPHKVRAGEIADVVVVLKLNDKPLSGAQVKLSMLFTPGPDYAFTPDAGVTDATGTFRSRVKVSKLPGDSVIAATSGVFSDQDHVSGTGADGKVVRAANLTNPAAQSPGYAPLALVALLALALVAAGFYLNVRSMGS